MASFFCVYMKARLYKPKTLHKLLNLGKPFVILYETARENETEIESWSYLYKAYSCMNGRNLLAYNNGIVGRK